MKKTKTEFIATVSLGAAFMCVCSWLQIPSAVPFTLQTFAVFLLSATFETKRSVTSIIVYLLLGTVGLPVFSGFQGGFSALAGPTGGFLFGFIPTAIIVGITSKKFGIKPVPTIVSCLASAILCYASGVLWYAFIYGGGNLRSAFFVCVVPFLVPDLIKISLAIIIAKRIRKIFFRSSF